MTLSIKRIEAEKRQMGRLMVHWRFMKYTTWTAVGPENKDNDESTDHHIKRSMQYQEQIVIPDVRRK